MYSSDNIPKGTCKFSVIPTVIVSCVWTCGLLIGSNFASQSSDTTAAMIHNAAIAPESFLCFYFALFLPFALTALFVRLSIPLLSIIVVFIKAMSVGFCACGIIVTFASAGWLIRALLLFSDSAIIVFLVWFWIRNITGNNKRFKNDLFLCAVASLMITCVDYFAVSPFLTMLLNI